MVAQAYDYSVVSDKVKKVFRTALGENATIVTNPSYLGRVHVKVVSERFDGITEQEKQAYAWDVLHTEMTPEEQEAVTLVMCYGTDEL